jgi:hypothetical protein
MTTSFLPMNMAGEFFWNGDNVNFFPLGLSYRQGGWPSIWDGTRLEETF